MNVLGLILGGGAGTRLQPLTRDRAKPAVPVGGKYRLVDIPISNCIHNGIKRIYLLTQFNSASLHQHIQSTYQFDQFHRNFVNILAAQQTADSEAWFEGTADAVRQTIPFFREELPDLVVIGQVVDEGRDRSHAAMSLPGSSPVANGGSCRDGSRTGRKRRTGREIRPLIR